MKIHFIGIGGIGVSALAQYYLAKGNEISGSDLIRSEITDFLKDKEVRITIGNLSDNVKTDADFVIYSPAVRKDNPELVRAKSCGIKVMSYPEALGKLTKDYFTIAVSGAHGKSTTTAMIGLILTKAGLDPTVIVGTKLQEFGNSNFRMGQGKYLVVEACEYDDSFLNYSPKIIVVTNVDKEHLDYFKNFENVIKAFKNFILKLPSDGFLVFNRDDKNIPRFKRLNFIVRQYSMKEKEAQKLSGLMKIPGKHNISNALASLKVARILNVPDKVSFKTLFAYRGSWRRFEILKTKPYILISDYGHHPNEISATLESLREKYANRKIWCIFQPHQYQRTYYLFDDFIRIFRQVPIDNIIITDIYDVAGREEKKISSNVSSERLVKEIGRDYIKHLSAKEAERYVKKRIKKGNVLIVMGAGDIYKITGNF